MFELSIFKPLSIVGGKIDVRLFSLQKSLIDRNARFFVILRSEFQ